MINPTLETAIKRAESYYQRHQRDAHEYSRDFHEIDSYIHGMLIAETRRQMADADGRCTLDTFPPRKPDLLMVQDGKVSRG